MIVDINVSRVKLILLSRLSTSKRFKSCRQRESFGNKRGKITVSAKKQLLTNSQNKT